MNYYNNNLKYPELFYVLDPEVNKCIRAHYKDRPDSYMPNQQELDNMVQEVYIEVAKKYPEFQDAPYDNCRYNNRLKSGRKRYGKRCVLEDFIRYLIIERLLYRKYYKPYNRFRR